MLRPPHQLWPLFILVALEFAWCSYLAVARVVPAGHDGLQYFYLKHYVFSAVVADGEVPLWLPYVTHGAPSTWWTMLQSGIFDPLGLIAAKLLRAGDFFPIFYALLFAEKALLAIGTWLFASEHFKAPQAVFAATAAVSATAIWYTQPWWNFHAIVALPMMLFFLHRTLVAFRWVWVVALSLLFYLQTFGQPVYYLPMTLLFLALYAAVIVVHREAAPGRRPFTFSLVGLLAVAGVIAAFATQLFWFRRSAAEMAFGSTGRSADGSIPLSTFFNYGGNTDLRMWNQFFLSLTPDLDFTMFAGFLIAGLAIVTFCSGPLNRIQRMFAWLTFGVLLVCTASPLATLIYYFWPLAGIFRHLSLLAPVAKFFVILLACATLDRLMHSTDRPRISARTLVVTAVVLGSWLIVLVLFSLDHARVRSLLSAMATAVMLDTYGVEAVSRRLGQAIVFLSLTVGLLIGLLLAVRRSAATSVLGWAAAALLLFDVTAYGILEMRARSVALTRSEAPLFALGNLPYMSRRIDVPDAAPSMRREMLRRVWRLNVGSSYWTENLLWQSDTYRSHQPSIYWSSALDALLRTVSTSANPAPEHSLPAGGSGVVPLIAGLSASKTRLLAGAVVCPDTQSTARVLTAAGYRGQVALITGPPVAGIDAMACEPGALPVEAEAASTDAARIVQFSSNRAEFEVDNGGSKPAVLTYSDAWSERWQARVNGKVAPVLRSDLAYKAVVVPPGRSRVVFEYRDRMAEYVFLMQALASAAFVVMLGVLGVLHRRRGLPARAA